MKKIAIFGSRGYIGSNLSRLLAENCKVVRFSSKSVQHIESIDDARDEDYSLESGAKISNEFDCIIFLCESKNTRDRDVIYRILKDLVKIYHSGTLILFSSLSIYSGFMSTYALFKLSLERVVLESPGGVVVRPGVVYGGIPGGLYKVFRNFRSSKILIVPCSNSVTGFTHIRTLSDLIMQIVNHKNILKELIVCDIKMNLSIALRYFGCQGFQIKIPDHFIRWFIYLSMPFKAFFPPELESLASLAALNVPSANSGINQEVIRRVIIRGYAANNKVDRIDFRVRGFIRKMGVENKLCSFEFNSKKSEFMFYKRLFEIVNLIKKQNEK